jgi:hypothetical protein
MKVMAIMDTSNSLKRKKKDQEEKKKKVKDKDKESAAEPFGVIYERELKK